MFNLRKIKASTKEIKSPLTKAELLEQSATRIIDSMSKISKIDSDFLALNKLKELVLSTDRYLLYASIGSFATRDPSGYGKIVKMLKSLGIKFND